MQEVYTFKVRGTSEAKVFTRQLMAQNFAVHREREWGQYVIQAVDASSDADTVLERLEKATAGLKKVTRV